MAGLDTMRLGIVGDSATTGYGVPAGHGYADRLESLDLPGRVLALGHDGATVRRWLPGGPHHTTLDQLDPFAPTHVVIALGGNDWYIARRTTDYTAHLVTLAGEIRERAPDAALIMWHYYGTGIAQAPQVCDIQPCNPSPAPYPTWHQYGAAMWSASMTAGAGYADSAEDRNWSLVWLPDRAHLTSYGHWLLYQSIRAHLVAP